MKFFPDKFKRIRQLKKISMSKAAKAAEIDRTTLWAWEKGKREPSEANIRILAKILDINVSEISDLKPLKEKVFKDFSKPAQSLLKISEYNTEKRTKLLQTFLQQVKSIDNELSNASIIINALISSFDLAFYIKDINQKYITANKAFLKMLKINTNTEITGKEDSFFFPAKEAAANKSQDSKVIATGLSVNNNEAPIPGTRKQRWGLISKTPVFDSTEKIIGLIGVFVDITERKNEESRRILLEHVMEQINCGIWICEVTEWDEGEFKFRYINNTIKNWLGCEKDILYENSKVLYNNVKSEFLSDIRPNLLKNMEYPATYEYSAELLNNSRKLNIHERIFRCDNNYLFGVVDDNTELNNLTQKNQRLRYLTDNITEDIIWYGHLKNDKTLELEYINDSLQRITGITPKNLKNNIEQWFDIIHPEDKQNYIDWDLKDKIPKKVQFRIINQIDGTVHWLSETIFKNNDIIYGIIKDITEEINVKSTLLENEKKFKDISYSLSGWLWEVNDKFEYTYCSDNILQILGYDKKEVIGKTPYCFMPYEESLKIKEQIKTIIKKKEPIKDLRNWKICKSGKHICLLINGMPFFDSIGTFKGYRGIDRDITKRINLEKDFKIFSDAVNSNNSAICINTLDHYFTYINPAFEKIFNLNINNLKDLKLEDIIECKSNEKLKDKLKLIKTSEKGWSGQVFSRQKNIKDIKKIVSISPVKDKTGISNAIICTFTDIPEYDF